jgi:hypothetical protein
MNAYGVDVGEALEAYIDKPFATDDFADYLGFALVDIEEIDSDGDGFSNIDELFEGSRPGDAESVPGEVVCPTAEEIADLDYKICEYDRSYVYRKTAIEFCGIPPTFEELESFRKLSSSDQDLEVHAKLDECLDTQFWQGFNGVLWSVAHNKIRPLTAFFGGETNFFADYALFTWTQTDGRDVRDMLTAGYFVEVGTPNGEGDVSLLTYTQTDELPGQPMQPERRVGLLTMAWPLFYNTMFTALPRATAAQAYRSFLGLDIAKSEGLQWGVAGEPIDYDDAGVTAAECADCHATLDPLAYPFATYNGLQEDQLIGRMMYDPDRVQKYFGTLFPKMLNMPESGVIMGTPVNNLLEWAQVAANSDQFYIARATDYWKLLMGETPDPADAQGFAEFSAAWEGLRESNDIEAMLHQLIDTEAYGAP